MVPGLAGVLLAWARLVLWQEYALVPYVALIMIAGAGFGVAAVHPPHDILRRLLVGVGFVVILLAIAAVVFITWFIWYLGNLD